MALGSSIAKLVEAGRYSGDLSDDDISEKVHASLSSGSGSRETALVIPVVIESNFELDIEPRERWIAREHAASRLALLGLRLADPFEFFAFGAQYTQSIGTLRALWFLASHQPGRRLAQPIGLIEFGTYVEVVVSDRSKRIYPLTLTCQRDLKERSAYINPRPGYLDHFVAIAAPMDL